MNGLGGGKILGGECVEVSLLRQTLTGFSRRSSMPFCGGMGRRHSGASSPFCGLILSPEFGCELTDRLAVNDSVCALLV